MLKNLISFFLRRLENWNPDEPLSTRELGAPSSAFNVFVSLLNSLKNFFNHLEARVTLSSATNGHVAIDLSVNQTL